MSLRELFKDQSANTFSMGAGKSGNRFQRRSAKARNISNDIDIIIHSVNTDLTDMKNDPQLKELVNSCYQRGCQSMESRGKNETLRGRLLQGDIMCYFVYTHIAPKPLMIVTDDYNKAQEFWEVATGVKRLQPKGFEKIERGLMSTEEQFATMLSTES